MSAVIIDYGMGNVASVQKALNFLNIPNMISKNKAHITNAKYIILPGVGSFAQGMSHLRKDGLDVLLTKEVIENKKPFLGICLGLQLIAATGTEPIDNQGLGWIKGKVIKIEEKEKRIPHLGWNSLRTQHPFFEEFHGKDFYFIHSYHFQVEDKMQVAAEIGYGTNYVAAIQHENIFAVQFHPEKSQEFGLKLLSKFFRENA